MERKTIEVMKDRFSDRAKIYAGFRPLYPAKLYEYIYRHVENFDAAWDAGTGNGQAARELSKNFKKVFATDISARQLEQAFRAPNIFYSMEGENTDIPSGTIDLITVAQAAHWFDMIKFSHEVKRVAKPGARVAIWGYSLLTISPPIDWLIGRFYREKIGPYWDAERKLVDDHYAHIYFPFREIQTPSFQMSYRWTLDELEGYLNTWSAVQNFERAHHLNPVPELMGQIAPLWQEGKQTVNFPLFLKLGCVSE
jgi:hypothetical protein